MNAQLHKIIFDRCTGQFTVVSEITSNQDKTNQGATSVTPPEATAAARSRHKRSE